MRRAVALLALALACGSTRTLPPLGHVVLFIDTDAPLPPRAGDRDPGLDAPQPLFDRLRVSVFEPGSAAPCAGCVREFAIDSGTMQDRKASIAIPQAPGVSGYRVRVQMFPAAYVRDDPPRRTTVDLTAALPPVPEEGGIDRTLFLDTERTGQPGEAVLLEGPPAESRVGTWAGARRVTCTGQNADGEVCIPGGAFWMGNPLAVAYGNGSGEPVPRLTVVSPFFLKSTEVTVADYSTFKELVVLFTWSGNTGKTAGDVQEDYCTYPKDPRLGRERLPMNCVSWAAAHAYCQLHGGELPTEAQLEYAGSGLRSDPFVWGSTPPSCDDAVWGRAGRGPFVYLVAPCKPAVAPGGALDVRSGTRDQLVLPTGTVFDLIGSVSEWALDTWDVQGGVCWRGDGVERDPKCTLSLGDQDVRTVRMGSWRDSGVELLAAYREHVFGTSDSAIGFRCARPDATVDCKPPFGTRVKGRYTGDGVVPTGDVRIYIGCHGLASGTIVSDESRSLALAGVVREDGTIDMGSSRRVPEERVHFVGKVRGTAASGSFTSNQTDPIGWLGSAGQWTGYLVE